MKRLLLLLPALVFAIPVAANPFLPEVNQSLIAQRGYDWEEEEEKEEKKTISSDVNIKGIDPKNLLFDTPISTTNAPLTKVLYDRAVEGDMCFLSCNFYNGVTSKRSDFFVDLQPFENFCMSLTGCSSQYPTPSDKIEIKVGQASYSLEIVDLSLNRYYLPLKVRKSINEESGDIILEIRGVKMPSYKIGPKNREVLRELVNKDDELTQFVSEKTTTSLKEKLVEAKQLLEDELISEEEYAEMRNQVLGLDN